MRTKHIILIATVVRVLQAVSTQTFFQPDEYFQSLEVAHHAVFGYGNLTWEWSTSEPIRSILFPSLWVPVYWLLKITGLHETNALVSAHAYLPIVSHCRADYMSQDLAGSVCGYHRCVRLSSLSPPVWSRICVFDSEPFTTPYALSYLLVATRQLNVILSRSCPCSDAFQFA